MLPRLKFVLLMGAVLATGVTAAIAEMNTKSPSTEISVYGPSSRSYGTGTGSRGAGKFLAFDLNHDGKITRDEFNRVEAQRFASIAAGGKAISAEQLAADATKKNRERLSQMFRRADWSGDGKLTLEEYLAPLRARFASADRAASGVFDCAPRNKPAAAGVAKGGKPRAARSSRGVCFNNDLNQDGKVTRPEFDTANTKKFVAAAKGGKTLSFDQYVNAGTGRFQQVSGRIFQRLDTNSDGKLVLAEYITPQQKQFVRYDRNSDGVVTRDELKAPAPRGRTTGRSAPAR